MCPRPPQKLLDRVGDDCGIGASIVEDKNITSRDTGIDIQNAPAPDKSRFQEMFKRSRSLQSRHRKACPARNSRVNYSYTSIHRLLASFHRSLLVTQLCTNSSA